jgi:NDP-sugar pyrophosphorylase family protein
MRAYILCGGLGTRLRSAVSDVPKCMASVDGKPFLEYLVRWLRKYEIDDIVLCVGYQRELIEETFQDGAELAVRISYAIEEELLGTGGAVKHAVGDSGEAFLVLNGDSFVNIDLHSMADFHVKMQGSATIALSRVDNVGDFGSVRFNQDFQITSFNEKTRVASGSGWVNAGIYIFEPQILDWIATDQKVSLEYDVFPRLANLSVPLTAFLTEERVLDIGTPDRYQLAQAFFRGMNL